MEWIILHYEDQGDEVIVKLTNGIHELEISAAVDLGRHRATLTRCHIQGARSNAVGLTVLRQLARWMKGKLDVDELRIEGAVRTSGAAPGRRPRPLTF